MEIIRNVLGSILVAGGLLGLLGAAVQYIGDGPLLAAAGALLFFGVSMAVLAWRHEEL